MIRLHRLHWWDRSLWFRVYRQGGFDGYRTIGGRRMPCDTMFVALNSPHLRAEIRRMLRR